MGFVKKMCFTLLESTKSEPSSDVHQYSFTKFMQIIENNADNWIKIINFCYENTKNLTKADTKNQYTH